MTSAERLSRLEADGKAAPSFASAEAGGNADEEPRPRPAFPTHSRIIQPGRTACDAWPQCRFEGETTALRDHMRACDKSEVGGIYRTLDLGRAIAQALKEQEAS